MLAPDVFFRYFLPFPTGIPGRVGYRKTKAGTAKSSPDRSQKEKRRDDD